METRKYTFFIKGVETKFYYDDEKRQYICENDLYTVANNDLELAYDRMSEKIDTYLSTLIMPKDNYFITDADFTIVPADVRILLGTENIKLEARKDLSYINLLADMQTQRQGAISGSKEYPTVMYIPKIESWVSELYQTVFKAVQMSSNIVYSLPYKFEQNIKDVDWDIVVSILNKFSINGNRFIITNCKNVKNKDRF